MKRLIARDREGDETELEDVGRVKWVLIRNKRCEMESNVPKASKQVLIGQCYYLAGNVW